MCDPLFDECPIEEPTGPSIADKPADDMSDMMHS